MKQFTRFRTLDELQAYCKEKNWPVDTTKYERDGSDFVLVKFTVGDVSGKCLFSVFNGSIMGETSSGEFFTGRNALHENEPWFQALLDMAYVGPKEEKKAKRKASNTNRRGRKPTTIHA